MRHPGFVHQFTSQPPQSYPTSSFPPSNIQGTAGPASPAPLKQKHISMRHYESLRREFHAHPELSGQESATAARITHYLLALGFPASAVHTGIGGHGIAAVLANGSGKTILLRSDTDGLPVREQTGLPFASTDTQVDAEDGEEKPVMHACGHDTHMTCLLAAAETLLKTKGEWAGTVIFVFQPAEEKLGGARRMVADGLYKRVPVPDVVLGQHVFPERAGTVLTRPGPIMAASDSMKITFYGRGAHASQPQNSIDPIVMAASAVLRLQTIVAREVAPVETAVVTVSAIHGGAAENVIGGDCFIRVNVRTYKTEVRSKILASIRRIVEAEARASGAERRPEIETTTQGPATYNDPETTAILSKAFASKFGDRFDGALEPVMGSEDFGDLATAIGKPSVFWLFGGTDQKKFDDAKRRGKINEEIPINHSPFFGPAMQPTLETGIDAMVTAAMAFVGKK